MPRDVRWWPKFLTPTTHKTQAAAPATPAAGDVVTYAKTDKRIYVKDDTGQEYILVPQPPQFQVASHDRGDALSYAGYVQSKNPLAHFQMGDLAGTTVGIDASGNFKHATWVNNPTRGAASIFDGRTAVTFNGTTQLANLPALGAWAGTDCTYAVMFKSTGTAAIVFSESSTTINNYARMRINLSGLLVFGLKNDAAGTVNLTSLAAVNDGLWHLCVIVKIGSNVYLYIDGVLQEGPIAFTGVYTFDIAAIGALRSVGVAQEWLGGTVADAAVFGTALTQEEITTLWERRTVLMGKSYYNSYYNRVDIVDALGSTVPTSNLLIGTSLRRTWGPELRRWNAAFSGRIDAGCDIVFIGDSITEGYYASTREKRFVELLRDALQLPKPGGKGFIPTYFAAAGYTPYWTNTGGTTSSTFGIGYRSTILDGAAETLDIDIECDRFKIIYTQGTGVGGLNISIDGAAATVINTYNATIKSGRQWDSGALTPGWHHVKLSPNNGQSPNTLYNVIIDGIMVYFGDYSSGVRIWEAGRAALKASDYAVNPYYSLDIDLIAPALVIIGLGVNDLGAGRTVAQFSADLITIIDRIKSVVTDDPSIMLMINYARSDSTYIDAHWQQYRETMYRVGELKGCAIFDVYELIGDLDGDPYGLSAAAQATQTTPDYLHLNNKGNRLLADRFVTMLANDVDRQLPIPVEGWLATGKRTDPTGIAWEPPIGRKRYQQVLKNAGTNTLTPLTPSGTTANGTSMVIMTETGTGSDSDGAEGTFRRYVLAAATINTSAGAISPYTLAKGDWESELGIRMRTDATITVIRLWSGFFPSSPVLVSTLANSAAFRYDTSVDGTAFWRCVSSNATVTKVTTTTVPVTAATNYLQWIILTPIECRFFINGIEVARHGVYDGIPVSSTLLGMGTMVTSLENVLKAVKVSRYALLTI